MTLLSNGPCIHRRFPGSLRRSLSGQLRRPLPLLTAVAPPPWCRGRRSRLRRPPPLPLPSRVGSGKGVRVRHPFRLLPVANEVVPGRSPPDWVSPPLQVGGLPVSALESRQVRAMSTTRRFGLRQQAGQCSVLLPLLVLQSPSEEDIESQRPPRCEVSTRAVHCSGRSPQPSGSGYRDQVVSPPAGGENASSRLGLPVAPPFHDEPQHEASPVLLLRPGSPGGLRGCVSPSLEQPERLRISSLSSGRKGGGSSQRDPKSLHDTGHPSLASEVVVRRPSPSADPTTSRTALVGPAVAAAPLQLLPPRRLRTEPSRLATLQRILRKSGFSRGSAIEMSAASGHPLPACTRHSGCSFVVGVVEGVLL